MKLVTLGKQDTSEVLALFCRCFFGDPYYGELFPDPQTRQREMESAFADSIAFCLGQGMSLGIRQGDTLRAFLLCFDYRRVRQEHPEEFRRIFCVDGGELPYRGAFHGEVSRLSGDVVYGMNLAVDPDLRRRGLASCLLDGLLWKYPQWNFVSDVSNEASLDMYRTRNFELQPLDTGYHLVLHRPSQSLHSFQVGDTVRLLLPGVETLDAHGIEYTLLRKEWAVCGFSRGEACSVEYFQAADGAVSFGVLAELSYDRYLQYQRLINVSQYTEHLVRDYALYSLVIPYTGKPLYNEVLEEMLPGRPTEWSLIPDVYVSVPVHYADPELIYNTNPPGDKKAEALLQDLDFRTHYEAGVPSDSSGVDDLAYFKRRIRRVYLGKLRIRIAAEATLEQYNTLGEPIGASAWVDAYISVDRKSGCGVLTWYSLSAPFLLSHLMDNVVRNQAAVLDEGCWVNFYDYLSRHYGVKKRGTPKIYVVLPREKSCLKPCQIASLLASETIYPDAEVYGQIIEPEIVDIAASTQGMGQYDRAFVCAYTNVMLQFAPDLKASLRERMYEESIALLYIELILFEEAAIQIADQQIVELFTSDTMDDPVEFLRRVDAINDEYTNTVDFWDVQVNYPTSQKSIHMLRTAFRIEEKLAQMQRNQEQLHRVFDTKCDIIDRRETKRMEKSLAVLSVLAVFSAWIDGHDYIATWSNLLPPLAVEILQKALFAGVLLVGVFTAIRLFGGRRKRRKKR